MDHFLKQQDVHSKVISRFMINFKKTGKANQTAGFVQARISLLNTYWSKFLANHLEMSELAVGKELSDPYFTEDVYYETESTYTEAMGALNDLLIELAPTPSTSGSSRAAQPASGTALTPANSHLPVISLPTFDGKYSEWISFRDLFRTLIDQNPSLTDVKRLQYLKTSLKGSAEQMLRHVAITDANYREAWGSLQARFENTRLIVTTYLQKLVTLPKIQAESATSLRILLDGTVEILHALRSLNRPVDQWDDLLVFLTVQKLDTTTRRDWETSIGDSPELPAFNRLQTFLENRLRTLEVLGPGGGYSRPQNSHQTAPTSTRTRSVNSSVDKPNNKCPMCSRHHPLIFCKLFRSKSVSSRREFILKEQLCFNCMRRGHRVSDCVVTHRCNSCNEPHHSMLHLDEARPNTSVPAIAEPPQAVTLQSNFAKNMGSQILLATAKVTIQSYNGYSMMVRALIDPGSQATLITESLAQQMNLPRRHSSITITGVAGSKSGNTRGCVSFMLLSLVEKPWCHNVTALVMPSLTSLLPTHHFETSHWTGSHDLQLADPSFNDPSPIELLIGADIYPFIIRDGMHKDLTCGLLAQNTRLGWILSGPIPANNTPINLAVHHTLVDNFELEQQISKLWELEEVMPNLPRSLDEEQCEQHFLSTHRRDQDGRYIVRLPLKLPHDNLSLGDSFTIALTRLHQMEKRFATNPVLQEMYTSFIHEYAELRHMEEVSSNSMDTTTNVFYLPHHSILKESSTTKLRVVFNASQATLGGKSLNECLHVGPRLQQELFSILLRWRKHGIVFSADVEKMYRQIKVDAEDADLQRILWRDNTTEKAKIFRLLTVTYGTACAPYLAIRCLMQLAADEGHKFPHAAKVLSEDFYVDDVLSGADDESAALQLQSELRNLLQSGGFTLRKWTSNNPRLVAAVPEEHREMSVSINLDVDSYVKTLGLSWNPYKDVFSFKVKPFPDQPSYTKRSIFSRIATLYDPIGWLSPIIIAAKILMQELWLLGVTWDEPLSEQLVERWKIYSQSLSAVQSISINRWLRTHSSQRDCQIHGFSDASSKAYAAVVYVRIEDMDGNIYTTLLTAKTKVAPLKTVTLPRLELCGAALLCRLLKKVQDAMNLAPSSIHAWTDATIVLHWLCKPATTWKVFVANRVAEIQSSQQHIRWRYVPTGDNPADCATRGLNPTELSNFHLWWNGPSWLTDNESFWPTLPEQLVGSSNPDEEVKLVSIVVRQTPWDLLEKYSSLERQLRITAWCTRFVNNLRHRSCVNIGETISISELRDAELFWIREVQKQHFSSEIMNLTNSKPINRSSGVLRLSPFMDELGILRVGGRLENADLTYDERHPILLPKNNHLSELIVSSGHLKTFHGPTMLLLGFIRQRFWILGVRDLVRRHIHRCLPCYRLRASPASQLMANLPRNRITQHRAFLHVGVDYAGPLQTKSAKGRGVRSHKSYIALFVCFTTKAVHIELVSDYSTDAFLASLKRFVARRGLCSDIYSDCGTNFVGANSQLSVNSKRRESVLDPEISLYMSQHRIQWHFNPPAAPHFGGLWEAGVKTAKQHLKRVLGDAMLTFEEMSTLLCQIEACMNSRPLHAMSTDANDLTVLTPAHFLIGESLLAVPEPNLLDLRIPISSRWRTLQQMVQSFWRRWSSDYLHQLQQRSKWLSAQASLKVGDLVLVKDERLPPTKWALARVLNLHPGADRLVRVVTLRCKNQTMKRPITKLCALPGDSGETS